jgi:hypothetical protein
MLPSSIFIIIANPLKFYRSYGSIPKHFDLPIQYTHWLDFKVFFWIHPNQIPINNMVMIMYILFSAKRHKIHHAHSWKQAMQACMQLALLCQISQMDGPHNLATNLGQFPNFNELFLGFTFKSTFFPTLNSLVVLFLST